MATFYNGKIVTDGLVLVLDAGNRRSYPTTGTSWADLSGNGNTGTLVNGPTFSTGSNGGIKFDAIDDYATIPDSNSLDFSTELTISLWFNRGDILALPAGDQHNLFVKGNTEAAGGDQVCPRVSLGGPTGGGRYDIRGGSLGGGQCVLTPPSQVLFANQWYNLTFTHVSGNAPTAYLNGVKQTDWVVSGTPGATATFAPNTFSATISGDVNRVTKHATFNGIMSIVMAYNRALSENEVIQNYNATRSRFGI